MSSAPSIALARRATLAWKYTPKRRESKSQRKDVTLGKLGAWGKGENAPLAAQSGAIRPKQGGMPGALFVGHAVAAAMEHAQANGGVRLSDN
jgi:hypothetical protein